MRKKQLETLEKINEERKLDKETKEAIRKKVLKNFLFATGILLFLAVLKLMALNLDKNINILVYKISSVILLVITLVLFEVAYKKDSDTLAITSIEMFFLSIITLLTPYILINRPNVFTSIMGVYFTIYYAIKNFIIYRKEKSRYLKEKNDIPQIIKKESKDELAQEQLEKSKQENEEKPKRKRGRPRKIKNE
ncbi:MAG: hypothetical protein J6A29_05280 [Clostridia bacterium]|nr:hypothetical protein [Clostridia bacterium]